MKWENIRGGNVRRGSHEVRKYEGEKHEEGRP